MRCAVFALAIGQLSSKKFDLVADARVAVEQDETAPFDPAAAAFCPVTRFTQKFFAPHFDVHALCSQDQFLKTGFLLVF